MNTSRIKSTILDGSWMSALFFGILVAPPVLGQSPPTWLAHDMNRPRPKCVAPCSLQLPVAAPEDAIVLFDGRDLQQWRNSEGQPADWQIRDGALVPASDSGSILSVRPFGDVQLHVEWSAPFPARGVGQNRGNSGVLLMGRYEIQVLDSYENETYADGYAASIYGQYPPLVNASLPPGQWQSYDIVFRRPRFRRDGTLASAARMTVVHNGILVQDNVELWGPTSWLQHRPYREHADKLPLMLQYHGSAVRFRNIWARDLVESEEPGPAPGKPKPVAHLSPSVLATYAGRYETDGHVVYTVAEQGGSLRVQVHSLPVLELVPHSRSEFSVRWTAARFFFELADDGKPVGLVFQVGGTTRSAKRLP